MDCTHPHDRLIKVPNQFHLYHCLACGAVVTARQVGLSPRQMGTNPRRLRPPKADLLKAGRARREQECRDRLQRLLVGYVER